MRKVDGHLLPSTACPLLPQVSVYLREHDTAGLDISVMSPEAAMAATCARARAGKRAGGGRAL